MKCAIRWAASLYPRAWRERYGVEFQALLDDVGGSWREVFNVLGGAIQMRLFQTRSTLAVVTLLATSGAIVAGAISFTGRQYAAIVAFQIEVPPGPAIPVSQQIDTVRHTIALADFTADIQRDIHIEPRSSAIIVTLPYGDKAKSLMAVRRLVDMIHLKRANIPPFIRPTEVRLTEVSGWIWPKILSYAAIGVVAGGLLGLMTAYARRAPAHAA